MHRLKALRHGAHSFTCMILHHACLSFVSIHQMAQSLTEVADIQLQETNICGCTNRQIGKHISNKQISKQLRLKTCMFTQSFDI